MQIRLILGADLGTRPSFQPSLCNLSVRVISPLDFTSVALTIMAMDTVMATTGIIAGTNTNTGTTVTGITTVVPHIGIRGMETDTGTIIVIGLLPPTTDIGDHITVTIIISADAEQRPLHQDTLVLPPSASRLQCGLERHRWAHA